MLVLLFISHLLFLFFQRERPNNSNLMNSIHRRKYDRANKPPYPYAGLITLAILSSPEKKMRLNQIIDRMIEMFPMMRSGRSKWNHSIRHNLSKWNCFKILRNDFSSRSIGNRKL